MITWPTLALATFAGCLNLTISLHLLRSCLHCPVCVCLCKIWTFTFGISRWQLRSEEKWSKTEVCRSVGGQEVPVPLKWSRCQYTEVPLRNMIIWLGFLVQTLNNIMQTHPNVLNMCKKYIYNITFANSTIVQTNKALKLWLLMVNVQTFYIKVPHIEVSQSFHIRTDDSLNYGSRLYLSSGQCLLQCFVITCEILHKIVV